MNYFWHSGPINEQLMSKRQNEFKSQLPMHLLLNICSNLDIQLCPANCNFIIGIWLMSFKSSNATFEYQVALKRA